MAKAHLCGVLGAQPQARATSRVLNRVPCSFKLRFQHLRVKKLIHRNISTATDVPPGDVPSNLDSNFVVMRDFHDKPQDCIAVDQDYIHQDMTKNLDVSQDSQDFLVSQEFIIKAHQAVAATGLPNFAGIRIPIISGLKIQVWRDLLHGYHDNVICDFLQFGWPLGFEGATLPVFDIRNHRGATTFPADVDSYLKAEISRGRIAGPFESPPFSEFVVSPCYCGS